MLRPNTRLGGSIRGTDLFEVRPYCLLICPQVIRGGFCVTSATDANFKPENSQGLSPLGATAHIAHHSHSPILLPSFVKPQIAPIGKEAARGAGKRGVTRNACAKSGGGLSMLDRSFRKRWKGRGCEKCDTWH
jgi:hypothetical protein